MEEKGWSVIKTATTGDQGVDLVAAKQDVRVAIQCKRYTGTIGNSAVQQVAAGRLLYATNYAVVVSNSSYTKSAVELARSANVMLLHHEDLLRGDFYR